MRNCLKGFTWKKLAYVLGFALLALALVDTFVRWKGADIGWGAGEAKSIGAIFASGAGIGENARITGESVFAFLLVGMIVGMLCGIAMAFAYFMWREKKLQENPDALTMLLEEIAREDAEALYVEDTFENDEKGDTLEPWERPTDWWKSEED